MFDNYCDILATNEVQEMLRIGRRSVYALIASGELDARRVGRKYRITKASVIRYMQASCIYEGM